MITNGIHCADTTDFDQGTNVKLCANLQSKSLFQYMCILITAVLSGQADHNFGVFWFFFPLQAQGSVLSSMWPKHHPNTVLLLPCPHAPLAVPLLMHKGWFFMSTLEMLQTFRSCPGIWVRSWMPPRRKPLHGHGVAWSCQKGLPSSRWTSGSVTGSAAMLGVEEKGDSCWCPDRWVLDFEPPLLVPATELKKPHVFRNTYR